MEDPEKNDPVWRLLSHASHTEPGPFFARDVVRTVRLSESESGSWLQGLGRFFRSPGFALGTAAAACVTLLFLLPEGESPTASVGPALVLEDSSTVDPATELESVAYLDQLMAVADPAQLSDDALADLFF